MVFTNYMKNSLVLNFKWLVSWKWGLPRPKVLYGCLFTSSTQKSCDEKILDCPEVPEGPLRVLIRFHSGRVFFAFLSNGILLRILSDRTVLRVLIERVFFEFPCCYSGSTVIDSSLGSYSAIFQACCYFLSKRATNFLIKKRCPVLIIFSKRTSHLTISSEKNKEILAWYRDEILYWKYMSSTSRFINYLYCWMYGSYILHKKFE